MKKLPRRGRAWVAALALGACATLLTPPAQAQAQSPRNNAAAIMVGHSLINYDMPAFLGELAASRGFGYSKAVQIILGSPLRLNHENCRRSTSTMDVPSVFSFSCDAIDAGTASGPYDTLILTEANNTLRGHRQYNSTDDYVARYMEPFLARNRSGRVFLFTTWEALPTYGSEWLNKQADDLAAYEDVARSAASIAASRGTTGRVEVIPVNIALRELIMRIERGEVPTISSRSQIFMDDVHMTRLGNYFVACVVFAAIYGQSPQGATNVIPSPYAGQPPLLEVQRDAATQIQRLAWEVVSTYRSGTAVSRPKAPASLLVR